jgi:hypothetical protein
MLERKQIQVVAEKLAGPHPEVQPEELDEPWRTVYDELLPWNVKVLGLEQTLWQAVWGVPDARQVHTTILEAMPRGIRHRCLLEMAADLKPVCWLWPWWIPRGLLSLLGSAPGAGKSLVALDLARRMISGEPFPDGAAAQSPSSRVVYVDAEAIPQIQNERAEAWQMDRSRIWLMLPPEPYGMLDFGSETDQDELVDICCEVEPDLVVVDSLSSISAKGENNVEDVRVILGFLAAVAREFDTGLLLIHHLRKRGKAFQGPAVLSPDDFRGSSHIIAMARSVLALSVVQDTPQLDPNRPRRLEVVKTNLCRYPEPLGVVFEEPSVDTGSCQDASEHGKRAGKAPVIRYVEAPKPYREPTQAEQCAAWLVEVLQEAGEPVPVKEVYTLAEEAGFKRGVVYRARKALQAVVVDTERSRSPRNRWKLAAADPLAPGG